MSNPKITRHNRFLHNINLCLNSHVPSINEHMRIPIGPKFDPLAELTLASLLVFILVFDENSL